MDLIDRYLQAVKFWLPADQKQDIVAELSEDIQAGIADREAELGRKLTSTDLEAILTRWGHPMLVAGRYLPNQQYLIGPVLFPVYTLVLKIVTLVYLVPWLLVWIGLRLFGDLRIGTSFSQGLSSFWLMALHIVAVVTAIVAVVERQQVRSKRWERWTAHELLEPRQLDAHAVPRTQSIAQLVVGVVCAWWWLGLLGTPIVLDRVADGTFRITLWPMAPAFYWLILVSILSGVALAVVHLRWPYWTRARAGVRLAIDLLVLAVACAVMAMGSPIEVIAQNPQPGVFELAKWANISWYISLAIIATATLAEAVQAARRMVGKRPVQNWAMTGLGAG